jgi:hypothetical protein
MSPVDMSMLLTTSNNININALDIGPITLKSEHGR